MPQKPTIEMRIDLNTSRMLSNTFEAYQNHTAVKETSPV